MNYKKYTKQSAFTLVELVVVATILAILWAVGFSAYTWYIAGARDANRLVQIASIYDGLNIYTAKWSLPIPDESIEIQMNGNVVAYQWYAGQNVLDTIWYKKWWKDPANDSYLSYYLDANRNHAQLLTFLEEDTNNTALLSWNTYANDYIDRIPSTHGASLGILTDEDNTPVQAIESLVEIWILDTAGTSDTYKAHISDTNVLTWDGDVLVWAATNTSCERIKESKWGDSDYYTISPALDGVNYRIYCDFDSGINNLLVQDWELGEWSIWDYLVYWSASESDRILGLNPTWVQDVVWESGSTDTGDNDGWWQNTSIVLDTSKTYRVSSWFKKTGNLTTWVSYLWTNWPVSSVKSWASTTNPYFWLWDFPEIDKWFLVVWYIHPIGYTGTEAQWWIYSTDSLENLGIPRDDFIHQAWNTIGRHRAYLRVINDSSIHQQFYDPRYEEIPASLVGDVKDLLPVKLN